MKVVEVVVHLQESGGLQVIDRFQFPPQVDLFSSERIMEKKRLVLVLILLQQCSKPSCL